MSRPRHHRIPLDRPEDWDAALAGLPHAFAHTWASAHAMHLTTGLETYLYCFEAADVRIVCPVAERTLGGHVDIVTPYGFSGFVGTRGYPDFPRHWHEFARAQGYVCGYIGLNPLLWHESYGRPDELHRYNHLYVLDLTRSLPALHDGLSDNRKRQLRAWAQSRATLRHDREALAAFFLEHHAGFLAERNASRASFLSAASLCALFAQRTVLLVGAGRGDDLEAVSVFAYTPTVGDYLFNVSVGDGQRHSAALIWYAVARLKELGVPALNLGGGIRENDGVAEFKRRFGARPVPLGSLRQVYDWPVFATLCRQADADPEDRAGYFPPYRRPARREPCS